MNSYVKFVVAAAVVALFILPFAKKTYDQTGPALPVDTADRLTILFVGDVMQHQTQIDAAYNPVTGVHEYDSCFKYVRTLISSYDVAIANLEVTLGGAPYTGYPQFSAPDNLAIACKNAGFDILATANNHSCDRGRKGIERTLRILDSLGIPHTGTFKDSISRRNTYPMIVERNGIRVALLNYTYGTNGIDVPKPNIVNLIEDNQIKADLKAAKDSMVDKIIVYTHWGDEYVSHPNDWQKHYAKLYFDNGADIVIGSHPHVIQKMERYHYPDSNGREVMIVYSLGNYISNQRDRLKDGGASIGFELVKKNGKTEISLAGYYLTWVWITLIEGHKQYYITPVDMADKTALSLETEAQAKMKIFKDDSRTLYGKHNLSIPEFFYDPGSSGWSLQKP